MKIAEFLKHAIDPLGIKNNDLEAALLASGLREIEIPDEVKDKFDRMYFTKERALNDEEINKALMFQATGKAYGSVDYKLEKIFPLLDEEDAKKISETKSTLDRLTLLTEAITKLKSSGHSNEDVKKVSQKAREIEDQLRKEIVELNKQQADTKESFSKQLKDEKMVFALKNQLKSFTLAPEFATDQIRRDFLENSTIDKLRKTYQLEFDEVNGSEIKLLKNVEGHLKEVYEGNKKVTLSDVMAKELEPFTQKSSGSTPPTPPTQKPFEIPSDKPVTLRDMQRTASN